MAERVKCQIGEVGFGRPHPVETQAAGWRLDSIIGKERVALLTKAMNGEELPDGLFLVGETPLGWRRITKDDVDWNGLTWYLENHGTRSKDPSGFSQQVRQPTHYVRSGVPSNHPRRVEYTSSLLKKQRKQSGSTRKKDARKSDGGSVHPNDLGEESEGYDGSGGDSW